MKPFIAFMCVGTHGNPYVTVTSTHAPSVGRYEIYYTRQDAENNALTKSHVLEVVVARAKRPTTRRNGGRK